MSGKCGHEGRIMGKYGLEGRFMDNVELYIRTGTFPSDIQNKKDRFNIKRTSKNVIYKDKCLFKSYKGRLLKVVRSLEQLPKILTRYHEDNGHAGCQRMREQIMTLYWWGNVTNAVKDWVKKCPKCRHRILERKPAERIQSLQCLAYGCESRESSSCNNPNMITFHKFPKDPAILEKWLSMAQRDRCSVRLLSRLCSNHFDPSCFQVDEEGQVILKPEAVPTIMAVQREVQLAIPADELSLPISTLEELITVSDAAETGETSETSEAAWEHPDLCGELLEHQYSLPPPPDANNNNNNRTGIQGVSSSTAESCFVMYDNIERFLTHRVLPPYAKSRQYSVRQSSQQFAMIDGVLMYTRLNPPRKVPRSREEVNEILCHFHDNQGHRGVGICQSVIWKQFFWGTLKNDLVVWISSCDTCINRTKRRMIRCSVYKCTNNCGPVERGLGMTFHKFPTENPALLSRWVRNLGRSKNWQPPLWSAVCASHFTEDCFDHSGNEVRLRPDAVPSLFVYSNPWDPNKTDPAQPAPLDWVTTQDQMFFAKYDAVERYLRRKTYPPGLNSVEKNTFRRFAKKYIIKDDVMHMVRGGRARPVLRNREDVEAALVSYHNDLNHLDVKKCLRLLNERYFWRTMKPDVMRWIDNCSECSGTQKKILKKQMEPQFSGDLEPTEGLLETVVGSPQLPQDSYTISEYGDDDDDDEEICSNNEELPECSLTDRKALRTIAVTIIKETSNSQAERQPQPCLQTQSNTPTPVLSTSQNGGTQLHSDAGIGNQPAKLNAEQPRFQTQTQTGAQTPTSIKVRPKRTIQDLVPECPAKRAPSQSQRVDPLVPQGPQTWPTLSDSEPTRAKNMKSKYSSKSQCLGPLQARVVVQHCSQARLKVRPAIKLLEAEEEWVEIQEGMVVYVCFFQGATMDVVRKMADTVMNAKLFRNGSRLPVSVLELPGSVLLVPQESLLGDQMVLRRNRNRIQYQEGCPPWVCAQLYDALVSDCRTAMATHSAKSKRPSPLRVTVEHGTYGQKQDIILSSPEPLTHLLEF